METPVSRNVAQESARQPQQYGPTVAAQNPPLPPKQSRDIQEQILETLQQIVRLQTEAVERPPPLLTEFLWTLLLQLLGLIIGALFGAFAILSWKVGDGANSLSSDANSLASDANRLAGVSNEMSQQANCMSGVANWMSLASFCASDTNASFCQPFKSDFTALGDSIYDNIASRASSCFTTGAVTTTSVVSSEPSSGGDGAADGAPDGQLAGIIVGGILAAMFALGALYLPYQTYRTKFRQQRKLQTAVI